MAKSQLKQLKERLKSNGFTGQTNVKKQQRKRVPASSRADKDSLLESIREEFNPFELKTTRSKHGDILGRKVQGAVGKPGLSKQIGEENRRKTLKRELERKSKVGAVIDRRFGENDSTLTSEEKMLERFTRERQSRSSRSSNLFNLEDDEDAYDADALTHFGQSLALEDEVVLEDGSKRRMGSDDDDDESQPDRKKSKNEVMKEVIAKSKMYKHERQKAKEEDQEVIENLDSDIAGLRSLLFQAAGTATTKDAGAPEDRDAAYDENVREMTFDKRAQPADRTKTEEELAEEHALNLKRLEEQRQRRMRGEVEGNEEDGKRVRNRVPDADDLSDDFMSDDAAEFGFGKGLDASDDDDDRSASSEVDDVSEDEKPKSRSTVTSTNRVKLAPRKVKLPTLPLDGGSEHLAFTYECPSSYEELKSVFGDNKFEDQLVIVERILVLHHPSLHQDNKSKLAAFAPLLVEHALALIDEDEKIDNDFFNKLIQKILELAKLYPEAISEGFRKQLTNVRSRLEAIVNANGETDYPLPSDVLLFTLVGVLFSTSDHFHIVVTPAMLLMGQHLAQFSFNTLGDLASSALIARLFAKYQTLSKRYVPEAVNYLNLSLLSYVTGPAVPEGIPSPPTITKVTIEGNNAGTKLRNVKMTDILSDTPLSKLTTPAEAQLALSLLQSDLETLRIFASLWKGKDAYKEIFTPSLELLQILASEAEKSKERKQVLLPVLPAINDTKGLLEQLIKVQTSSRRPLALHAHKPIPIPSYVPKFEENYSVDKKSYDPNVQRQEISKLRAQVKKERKGALRELRKDNAFISREKLAEKKKKDSEYHEMLARLERTVNQEG